MTKNEFFSSLDIKLSILNEKERADIMDEYRAHIDLKVKDGKTEEQAIADFGDIDDLAREILDAYHIDSSSAKSKNLEYYIKVVVNFINQTTEKLLSFSGGEIARVIVEFLLVLCAIALLSIPFDLLLHSFENFFYYSNMPIITPIAALLGIVVDILKLGIGLLIVYSFIKNRILSREYNENTTTSSFAEGKKNSGAKGDYNYSYRYNYKDNSSQSAAPPAAKYNTETGELETPPADSYSYEKSYTQNGQPQNTQHSEQYSYQKNQGGGNFVINLVVNILKIFLFMLVWLPCAISTIVAIVCTVIAGIFLAVKGIGFWGICIIGAGCCIIGIAFTAWLGDVIFGGKKKNA